MNDLTEAIDTINKVQEQFKNSFAIIIGMENIETWNAFQLSIDAKSLRLLRCTCIGSAASAVLKCYDQMKNNEKLKLQTTYFALENEKICTSSHAKTIVCNAFEKMQIPSFDTQMIIDGCPSIARIISCSKDEMEANIPVDARSIEKITAFFSSNI
jgi:hypothetical protein